MSCPCGVGPSYNECCEPFIKGQKHPATPEQLMRSRYSAHVKKEISYLRETLAPEVRSQFNEKEVREWVEAEWLGLEILSAQGNKVEFTAKYNMDGKTLEHHEVSKFRKVGDRWYFVDGDHHVHEDGKGHHHHHAPQAPIVREADKIGRNDPCVCGSGKKYKKCCGA